MRTRRDTRTPETVSSQRVTHRRRRCTDSIRCFVRCCSRPIPRRAHDARPRRHSMRRRQRVSRGSPRRGCRESPVDAMGIRFPNRVGLAAGLDKNARASGGPRDARLRIPRGRHRDAAPAARQSAAAHVPHRRSAGARQPARLQQRRRGGFVANVAALAATAACSASTSAGTSTRRTSAPPTTTSRACAPSTRMPHYVDDQRVVAQHGQGLRDLQAERRARRAARARSWRERDELAQRHGQSRAARGQDRARSRRRQRSRDIARTLCRAIGSTA